MKNIYTAYAQLLKLISTTEKVMDDSQTQDVFHPGYGIADAFVMLGKLKRDVAQLKLLVDAERRKVCAKCTKENKKNCLFFNDKVPLELTGNLEYTTKCCRRS
jgi:hypothetical protein